MLDSSWLPALALPEDTPPGGLLPIGSPDLYPSLASAQTAWQAGALEKRALPWAEANSGLGT